MAEALGSNPDPKYQSHNLDLQGKHFTLRKQFTRRNDKIDQLIVSIIIIIIFFFFFFFFFFDSVLRPFQDYFS